MFSQIDSYKTLMGALMTPLGWPQIIERLWFKRTQGNFSHFGEVWISIVNLHCILEPSDDPSLYNASKVTQIQTLIEEINIENNKVSVHLCSKYLSNKIAIKIS